MDNLHEDANVHLDELTQQALKMQEFSDAEKKVNDCIQLFLMSADQNPRVLIEHSNYFAKLEIIDPHKLQVALKRLKDLARQPFDIKKFEENCITPAWRNEIMLLENDKSKQDGQKGVRILDLSNPLEVTKYFLIDKFNGYGKNCTLVHFLDSYYTYTDGTYQIHDDTSSTTLRGELYLYAARSFVFAKQGRGLLHCKLTKKNVEDTFDALPTYVRTNKKAAPFWKTEGETPPEQVIVFNDCLLHVPPNKTWTCTPHSPNLFNTVKIPCDYNPSAQCPTWHRILNEYSGGDQEWIYELQKLIGYCLTTDNSLEIFALLQGPPGTGKSTVLWVICLLIGNDNIATPSLTELGSNFGLHCLTDKILALISDVNVDRNTNLSSVTDTIKRITGNDSVNITRKYKNTITNVHLPLKFIFAMNEIAPLPDSSGAFERRLRAWPFKFTIANRDSDLREKLHSELAGIAQWGLQGLLNLYREKSIKQPACGLELVEEFLSTTNPLGKFLHQHCTIKNDPHAMTPKLAVYRLYTADCKENGKFPMSNTRFGQLLKGQNQAVGNGPSIGTTERLETYLNLFLTDSALYTLREQQPHVADKIGGWVFQELQRRGLPIR